MSYQRPVLTWFVLAILKWLLLRLRPNCPTSLLETDLAKITWLENRKRSNLHVCQFSIQKHFMLYQQRTVDSIKQIPELLENASPERAEHTWSRFCLKHYCLKKINVRNKSFEDNTSKFIWLFYRIISHTEDNGFERSCDISVLKWAVG